MKPATKFEQLSERMEALSLRERVILLATLIVLVLFIWMQFFYQPYDAKKKKIANELVQTNQQITNAAEEIAILELRVKEDPNEKLRAQQYVLQQQLKNERRRLEKKLEGLVVPEKMAELLRDVLESFSGLKLIEARNLPSRAIRSSAEASDRNGPMNNGQKPDLVSIVTDEARQLLQDSTSKLEAEDLSVYSHGMELILEGSFFDLLGYLRRLEALDASFQWEALDYQVAEYPKARVRLLLKTLSLERPWIGV